MHRDQGVTAVEYALIAGLVAGVVAATVALFGAAVLALFDQPLLFETFRRTP